MALLGTSLHIFLNNFKKHENKKTPFSKVIKLPQMLGYDQNDSKIVFNPEGTICFWKQAQLDSWSPKSREYSTCTFVDGSLVQFGGLNAKMLNDVNILDFRTWKWMPVKFDLKEYVPEPRYGHIAVSYKTYVVIHGGYRRFLASLKARDAYGDVAYFNTDTLKWDKPVCQGITTFRRHHTAAVVGKTMIIHGGLDEKSQLLSSVFSFNLQKYEWKEVK